MVKITVNLKKATLSPHMLYLSLYLNVNIMLTNFEKELEENFKKYLKAYNRYNEISERKNNTIETYI